MGKTLKNRILTILALLLLPLLALAPGGTAVAAYDLSVINGDEEQITVDKYKKENRQFAAIPAVEVTGDRLWSAWMSGGDTEPHNDNYITVAYSDDGGSTWVEPHILVDPGHQSSARSYNPVLWRDPLNRLWLFWGQAGCYYSLAEHPEADPAAIRWSAPVKINSSILFNKPIVTVRDGVEEWLMCTQNYSSSMESLVYASRDQGQTWTLRGKAVSQVVGKNHHEPMLVQRADGVLWMLSRVEKGIAGGIEQAFSEDGGATWTTYQYELGRPLRGPGSRFNIYRLQSGNIIVINHDSETAREKLTAWLSVDDGSTFPYELLLDHRDRVSYPDIAQAGDGTIYVVYDMGRSVEQEIRMAVFRESDVMAGEFQSAGAGPKRVVSKTGGYSDIVATLETYARRVEVAVGTPLAALLDGLPQTVTAVDEQGAEYRLTGEWQANGDTAVAGRFEIRFDTVLPEKVADVFALLTVRVTVIDERPSASGCKGTAGVLMAGCLLWGVLLWKKK